MGEEDVAEENALFIRRARRAYSQHWLVVLLVVSNIITFLLSSHLHDSIHAPLQVCEIQQHNSSLRSGIDNGQHTSTFTGLKYIPNNFSAPPGGEINVDAAWASIGTYFDRFLIPAEEATMFTELLTSSTMFLTPESIVSGPKSPLPRSGYPVFIEAFHQLHCVDLMRQALYFNADYYRSRGEGVWASEQKWIQNHVNHCMDYLRRLAMCHAETGLITFSWRNEEGDYMLNYEQKRQCGDFGKVLEWAREHEVDLNNGDLRLMPPKGAVFKEPVGN